MRQSLIWRSPAQLRPRAALPHNHALPAIYRLTLDDSTDASATVQGGREPQLAWLEAALFAADEPLTARRLAQVAGLVDGTEARRLMRKLQGLYDKDESAFQVEEIAGGFQLLTRPEFQPWLVRIRRTGGETRLSGAARETLAIIAYRQPIMRADVEAIRGVQCSDVLRQLMERGLIRITGRHESLGRPVLYGTTKKFLQMYGLKSLRDLPRAVGLSAPEPPTEES